MSVNSQAVLRWACAGGVPFIEADPLTCTCSCQKFAHGQSNPTFLVTVSLASNAKHDTVGCFVLRCRPHGKLLPSAHRIDREYALYKALAATDVPVPAVYGYCTDVTVIGVQFFAMEYVNGRVFTDVTLTGHGVSGPAEKTLIYQEAVRVLSRIGAVDVRTTGLHHLKRHNTPWARRQLSRWTAQFIASKAPGRDYPEMESLITTLEKLYCRFHEQGIVTLDESSSPMRIVHGDYRLDNCIFHPSKPIMLAIIDWELSTIGDTIADFATFLTAYYLPPGIAETHPQLAFLGLPDQLPAGIPSREEIIRMYANFTGMPLDVLKTRLNFHIGLALFRLAAIGYGVAARARSGNASSRTVGCLGEEASLILVRAGLAAVQKSAAPTPCGRVTDSVLDQLTRFMKTEVMPLEHSYLSHVASDARWSVWAPIEELKTRAREAGLWNLWLPKHLGGRLTACQYAPVAAQMGRCSFGAEVFNCSAPDTGNMELLARFGTPVQKERWLKPLLDGEIRSCFAMTEPDVASSDPTNLSTSVVRTGSSLLVNGRKWWISGAMDPRCEIVLLLGRGPNGDRSGDGKHLNPASRHSAHSIVLIPVKTSGVKIVRFLTVMGYDDAPHGHAEISFSNVKVPAAESIILGEGRGFEAAQSRLGGGRLHHCMRAIGAAERSLELMIDRATSRVAFGKTLDKNDSVLHAVALSRCDIEQGRNVVLMAAKAVDSYDLYASRRNVAIAKVVVPRLMSNVIDRAVQVHGACGVSQDTVLAHLLADVRSLRLADGPDEVHLTAVGKMEIRCWRKANAKL